jgi:hypothetical protein
MYSIDLLLVTYASLLQGEKTKARQSKHSSYFCNAHRRECARITSVNTCRVGEERGGGLRQKRKTEKGKENTKKRKDH